MQLLCNFCNKSCKNDNSLRNHERLCKLNADRQFTIFSDPAFQKSNPGRGSNQYIVAKREGRTIEVSTETSKKISDANLSRSSEFTAKIGRKISETVLKKVSNNEWHTSLAKHMHYSYKGADLHGSWEYKYAQYLDDNNIEWQRCKESFKYFFEDKWRTYTPDFYLPATDEYIEIKGYKTKKDEAKWLQFPSHRTLIVLMKKELCSMNII